ncbi:integral membrane protein [Rutstroemia sp. NJR-2017a BBW]|nr:integral membrane protein [Rutstroemia sp. NJR-2017a BBW]
MDDASLAKEDLGPTLVIIAWTFAAIATIVVFVRYYVRLRIVRKTTFDDLLILLTLCLAIGDSVFCTLSVHWGLGRHIQFLSPDEITNSIKWIYLCEFFSIMSPGFGRISFAFLLLGLIPPTKWRQRYLWSIITCQFIVDVVTVIISFSQCRPMRGFWDSNVHAHCWLPSVQQRTGYFQGSVCSLVDMLLALFPASLFWSLQMKLRMKISLSILMGLGLL